MCDASVRNGDAIVGRVVSRTKTRRRLCRGVDGCDFSGVRPTSYDCAVDVSETSVDHAISRTVSYIRRSADDVGTRDETRVARHAA